MHTSPLSRYGGKFQTSLISSVISFLVLQVDNLALLASLCKDTFRPRDGITLVENIIHAAAIALQGTPGPVAVEVTRA